MQFPAVDPNAVSDPEPEQEDVPSNAPWEEAALSLGRGC